MLEALDRAVRKMMKLRFANSILLLVAFSLQCAACVGQKRCTFVPLASSAGAVIPDGFGVNIHFTEPKPGEIKMLSEGGFRWVRMDLKWDSTETQAGRYDFSDYDRLMAGLQPFNIRPLFILDYGNPLYDNGAPPRTDAARKAFTSWAVAAAKHFSGRGAIWEIYNEPNIPMFWPPKPNAQEYVALALAVGRGFRDAVPNEKLIGPATSEIDFGFLESCFKAGLLEYWSAVSIHPYRQTDPETAAEDYCRLREMIKTYAGGKPVTNEIPIISSEWGYSAVWRGMSEQKQGQLLARAWLTNVGNGIPLSIWYDWRNDGMEADEPEHHFGTVSNSYREGFEPVYVPKPAYMAAKTLSTFFDGYRYERRIDVGGRDDYVLSFRKGGDLRVAAWTTSQNHNVLIPLEAGAYKSIRHTGEDRGVVGSGQNGLALTLSTAPVYLRRQ